MSDYEIQSEESKALNQREHNIDASAKRVVQYHLDGDGNYVQVVPDLVPGVDFDYLSATNTDTDEDTLVFKTGGSGGTTVQTIVITYPGGADKVSDAISVVEYS